jgi:hypothetical protein
MEILSSLTASEEEDDVPVPSDDHHTSAENYESCNIEQPSAGTSFRRADYVQQEEFDEQLA